MNKLFTFCIVALSCLTLHAQQTNNTVSARNEAVGAEVSGVAKAVKNFEPVGSARLQSILQMKKTLNDAVNLQTIDTALSKSSINSNTFNTYLKNLIGKYENKLQQLAKDNLADATQLAEKSALKSFYSASVSASCLANTSPEQELAKIVDYDGNEIVAFPTDGLKANTRYGLVDNYKQGFARIKKDQVFGFLNQCGEESIPAQFEMAEPFNDGKAAVKKFIWYFVDVNGEESEELFNVTDMQALKYGIYIAKFKNNKFALIDNEYDVSRKVLSPYFDQVEAFTENTYKVRNGKQYGIIKLSGEAVIDVAFEKITPDFSKNLMVVERNKKMGVIDMNGTVRINPTFESVETVFVGAKNMQNLSPVVVKDETGYKVYELTGNKISNNFSSLEPFNNFGLAKACIARGNKLKCGFVNYEGSEVVPIIHDDVSSFSKYGMVVAKDRYEECNNLKQPCEADMIYDATGRIVVDKVMIEGKPVNTSYFITDTLFTQSLVIVKTRNKLDEKTAEGIILLNKATRETITPTPVLIVKRFGEDMIATMIGENQWGVIDMAGKTVVKPIYKEVVNYSEGMYGVRFDNNKLGYIDRKGKVQVTFDYTEIGTFKNGLAIVSKGNGKMGIVTKFNAKIAPCVFKEVTPLDGGNYEVVDSSGTKFLLNSNGDCQTNCAKFDEIRKKANNL
jgi:hypothetical protein